MQDSRKTGDDMDTVEVPISEVRELYALLEKLNATLHQPLSFEDPNYMRDFATKNYPALKSMYYDVVWNWLPPDVQEELVER